MRKTTCLSLTSAFFLSLFSNILFFPLFIFETQAAGMTVHIFMADEAVQKVQNPDLKEFLIKQRNAVRNGAIFPDSGYLKNATYGEYTHWAPFHNQFALLLEQQCPRPLNAGCEELFGFYLGTLSHAISDVPWHRDFVAEVTKQDFHGDHDKGHSFADTGMDMLAIMDYGRGLDIPPKSIPAKEMNVLFEQEGIAASVKDINSFNNSQYALLIGERVAAPASYLYYKLKGRWAAKNYYAGKGGVLESAMAIAKMWDLIWTRYKEHQSFSEIAKLRNEGAWPQVEFFLDD